MQPLAKRIFSPSYSAKMADVSDISDGWRLYYWPSLPGRGDFVRLMFEEAGVPYEDVCRGPKGAEPAIQFYKGKVDSMLFPVLAPPIIQKEKFVMNQTPAIMEYLGKKFDMYPTGGPEVEAHAMQVNMAVADYIAEGHDAFHPVVKTGTYDSQKTQAEPYIARFKKERMPRSVTGLFIGIPPYLSFTSTQHCLGC